MIDFWLVLPPSLLDISQVTGGELATQGYRGYPLSQIVAGCLGTKKSCGCVWTRATPIPRDFVSPSSTVKIPLWILHFRTNQDIRLSYWIVLHFTIFYNDIQDIPMNSDMMWYVIILNNLLFIVTMDIPSFPAANVIPTVSLNSLGGASWWSWRRSFGPRLTRFCVQYFPGNKPGNWTLLYLKQTKMSNLLKINDILVCFLKGPDKVFQYLC